MPCFRGGFSQRASPTPNTSQGGGGFITPNLMNNYGFETAWGDGTFTDWDGVSPPDTNNGGHVSLSSDAFAGTKSMQYTIAASAGESGSHTICHVPGNVRLWTRFYFKITSAVDSIWKFHRFYDQNFQNASGGWFMQNGTTNPILGLSFDQIVQTTFDVGINRSEVVDGNWHYIEVDYWRSGGPTGNPSFACWYDGTQRFHANGPADGNADVKWIDGRLDQGFNPGFNTLIGYIEWIGTLNASNTQTGTINIDRVAISNLGRIGP